MNSEGYDIGDTISARWDYETTVYAGDGITGERVSSPKAPGKYTLLVEGLAGGEVNGSRMIPFEIKE